jgi:hypothetical protein
VSASARPADYHDTTPDDTRKFGELLKQTNPNSEVVGTEARRGH